MTTPALKDGDSGGRPPGFLFQRLLPAREVSRLGLTLPPQASTASYAKATISAGSLGSLTAKPIIYGLTIPSNAPDPALAQKFIAFVLSLQGQAVMQANGFTSITPALASSQGKVPASLQSLTTQWPGG